MRFLSGSRSRVQWHELLIILVNLWGEHMGFKKRFKKKQVSRATWLRLSGLMIVGMVATMCFQNCSEGFSSNHGDSLPVQALGGTEVHLTGAVGAGSPIISVSGSEFQSASGEYLVNFSISLNRRAKSTDLEACLAYTLTGARTGEAVVCNGNIGPWVGVDQLPANGWTASSTASSQDYSSSLPSSSFANGSFELFVRTKDRAFLDSAAFVIAHALPEASHPPVVEPSPPAAVGCHFSPYADRTSVIYDVAPGEKLSLPTYSKAQVNWGQKCVMTQRNLECSVQVMLNEFSLPVRDYSYLAQCRVGDSLHSYHTRDIFGGAKGRLAYSLAEAQKFCADQQARVPTKAELGGDHFRAAARNSSITASFDIVSELHWIDDGCANSPNQLCSFFRPGKEAGGFPEAEWMDSQNFRNDANGVGNSGWGAYVLCVRDYRN